MALQGEEEEEEAEEGVISFPAASARARLCGVGGGTRPGWAARQHRLGAHPTPTPPHSHRRERGVFPTREGGWA